MAPVVQKKTIQHFTHPSHALTEVYEKKEYICDGCRTLGIGTRYRCDVCDFDLHVHCGTCPSNFSSFMHPQHQLNLVLRKPQGVRQNERVCDVCGDHVEGLFYRCKICDFDVHPLCTQLPQHVRHVMHPQHPLTLLHPSSAGWCMVCNCVCTSWRYTCGICCVHLHLECVLSPCGVAPSPPLPPQPPVVNPYGAYAYGVPCSSSTGPYHNMHQCSFNPLAPGPQGGGVTNGRKVNKMVYDLVEKLALGMLTNGLFGLPDFSSFI